MKTQYNKYPIVTVFKEQQIYNHCDNCRFCVHYTPFNSLSGISTIIEVKRRFKHLPIYDISNLKFSEIADRQYLKGSRIK